MCLAQTLLASRADVHAIEGTLPEVEKIAYRARHELGVRIA